MQKGEDALGFRFILFFFQTEEESHRGQEGRE